MGSPERPTEDQILDWLSRAQVQPPRLPPGRSPPLPRVARILWLRYCADPPLGLEAIAVEYGVTPMHASALVQRGLALLAAAEEQGLLPAPWDTESPLGRAVIRWRLRHRSFVPRPRGPGAS